MHASFQPPLSPGSYAMTLFIPAMWAIIRFFHAAAHLTLVTSGVMARELAAQVGAG